MPKTLVRPREREFVEKTKHKFRKLKDSRLLAANSADEVVEALQALHDRYQSCLLSSKCYKESLKIKDYLHKHCPQY